MIIVKVAFFFVKLIFFKDVSYIFLIKDVTIIIFYKWFHSDNGFFPVILYNICQNFLLSQVAFKYSKVNAFSHVFAMFINSWSAFLLDLNFW